MPSRHASAPLAMMTEPNLDDSNKQLLDRISAAATDQRAHNIRYRQNALQQLHGFLRRDADALCDLERKDLGYSKAESQLELYLTLKAIADLYDQLDFHAGLEQEYLVAKRKSNLAARVPYGVVIVRPASTSRLFSIMSAVGTAIAAGNCVVLELPKTTRHLDTFLRKSFTVLDREAFAISTTPITDGSFISRSLVVDQVATDAGRPGTLAAHPRGLAVAVVDRTADISRAANTICALRFLFNGKSSYAPDLVVVNEWVWASFIAACLQSAASVAANRTGTRGPLKEPTIQKAVGNVLFDSNGVRLVELEQVSVASCAAPSWWNDAEATATNYTRTALLPKAESRILYLTKSTGLVDTVTRLPDTALLASYYFSDSATAKFLSQQISSELSAVNHIPLNLLVGPEKPCASINPSNPELRYETSMMSKPSPAIVPTSQSGAAENLLKGFLGGGKEEDLGALDDWRKLALKPLKATGQGSGSSMGFFEQGILTGFIAFVLPSIGLLGFGAFKAMQFARGYF